MRRLKEAGVANALLMALKDPTNLREEIFAQNALYSLRTLADLVGIADMDIGKEGIMILQESIYAHAQHEYIQDTSNALLQHMVQAFAGGTEALLEDKLRNLASIHAASSMWQQVIGEDGNPYFYNSETQESSWEQAMEHYQLSNELDSILTIVTSLDGNMKDLDIATSKSLIGIIGSHARDASIMKKVLDSLSGICNSETAAAALANATDVSVLISAMQFHVGDVGMMCNAVDILDTMAGFDHLKGSLSSLEYITTVNQAIWNHIDVKKLVTKGTGVLVSILFGF